MPDVTADRRDAPRFPLILVAEIIEVATGNKLLARTADVSRTGCYIDTLNPLPKGTPIKLRLVRGSETLEVPGKVVYVSPGLGMGLRFFEEASESQLAILDRWLSQAARNL